MALQDTWGTEGMNGNGLILNSNFSFHTQHLRLSTSSCLSATVTTAAAAAAIILRDQTDHLVLILIVLLNVPLSEETTPWERRIKL